MPPVTHTAVHDVTSLLTATPDEAAIHIAAALADPHDLLRLARACRRFATKCIAAPPALPRTASAAGTAAAGAAAQQLEMLSIVEEAARRWIADCTDQERGWVPRCGRDSWLGLMSKMQSLCREAAVFGRSHLSITVSEGGQLATIDYRPRSYETAATTAVMHAGWHCMQFTVASTGNMSHPQAGLQSMSMCCGVIRPGWDVGTMQDAPRASEHCFYRTFDGMRYAGTRGWDKLCSTATATYMDHEGILGRGAHDWEGMQGATEEGDRIGMLLDLDQGSMTVYKNDERLGVMATGLSGEYCWAVSLLVPGCSVRIDPVALPHS
jgi:hypothetical protein